MQSCADPVQGLHGRLARTSGRKWRIRAAPIRPKLTRGMTNASSIAVAKLPRTTSDRRLAIRRIRADTCVSSAPANSWYSKTLGSGDANEKALPNLRGRSFGLIAALRRSTGKDDPFFLPAGAEAFRRDIPGGKIQFFDTGHFALESHVDRCELSPMAYPSSSSLPVSKIRIRQWQRLCTIFITSMALWKYRMRLPGFELPDNAATA
jgi:hypothetical protein